MRNRGSWPMLVARFGAAAVDAIVSFGATIVLALLGSVRPRVTDGGGHALSAVSDAMILAGLWLLIWFAYSVTGEAVRGQTVGKALVRMRVVMADGRRCTLRAAIERNLTKAVVMPPFAMLLAASALAVGISDFDYYGGGPLLLLVGIVTTALLIRRNASGQRLGDRLAGSVVVRTQGAIAEHATAANR